MSSNAAAGSKLAGQSVLVTGGAGFIGSALCRQLTVSGSEVHAVSRQPRTGNGVIWWRSDLAAPDEASLLLRRAEPSIIFHLASHVSGNRELETVAPTVRDNLLTTVNLLTAAARFGRPRVVLAGSMEESTIAPGDQVPSSPYAAAKTAATSYGQMFHAVYGLPVVVLRLFMVYGPGQQDDTKLVPYVISRLLHEAAPELTSGSREIDWIYIDDVVDAFLAAAVSEEATGRIVEVGSGSVTSIRTLVGELVRLIGSDVQPLFGARPDRALERPRVADISSTFELIGWRPSISMAKGLAATVEWFRNKYEKGQAS